MVGRTARSGQPAAAAAAPDMRSHSEVVIARGVEGTVTVERWTRVEGQDGAREESWLAVGCRIHAAFCLISSRTKLFNCSFLQMVLETETVSCCEYRAGAPNVWIEVQALSITHYKRAHH